MDSMQSAREAILAALPRLRAYAVSLTGSRDRADDLVQEALVRAFEHVSSLQPHTNTLAWLITILRNRFVSDYRKRRHEVEDAGGRYTNHLICGPDQDGWMAFQDFRTALARLPLDQREAIILVGAAGFSYEQAAEISGCPAGTIKSRVSRARSALARALSHERITRPSRSSARPSVTAGQERPMPSRQTGPVEFFRRA